MSKIFLIGDTHIGLGYPNSVEKWHKVHKQYFSEFLIPLLKEKVEPHDIIVHLGDLFDNLHPRSPIIVSQPCSNLFLNL